MSLFRSAKLSPIEPYVLVLDQARKLLIGMRQLQKRVFACQIHRSSRAMAA